MEYTVQLSEDQKIVTAWATGEWDAAADNSMIYKILEMVDASGSRKVLLDVRELKFRFTLVQIFNRAKEMKEQRRKFRKVSAKVAIIFSSSRTKIEDDLRFFENTTRNRGLPYRAFNNIESAMAWLMDEER